MHTRYAQRGSMQIGAAHLKGCSALTRSRLLSTKCLVRAISDETRSRKPSKNFTDSVIEFFNDITEGARDDPRRSMEDVPDDVADLAAKVHNAADEVNAAAERLKFNLSTPNFPVSSQQDLQIQPAVVSDLIQQGLQTLDTAAADLQRQITPGDTAAAAAALDKLMSEFAKITNSISAKGMMSHSSSSSSSNNSSSSSNILQTAINKCRVQAATSATMVSEALQKQHISEKQAVQHLSNLLKALARDLEATVINSVNNNHTASGTGHTTAGQINEAPSTAMAAAGAPTHASNSTSNNTSINAVHENNRLCSYNQLLSVEAAAKAIVQAGTIAASIEQQLPALKQKLNAAAKAAKGRKQSRAAAARIFTILVDELISQMSEYALANVSFGLSSTSNDDLKSLVAAAAAVVPAVEAAGPAAALQQVCEALDVKGRQLAVQIEAGEMKSGPALNELLKFLQAQVAGQLRSTLLDGLLAQSTAASSSSSSSAVNSKEATTAAVYDASDVAAQLAAAITATRKQQLAAAVGVQSAAEGAVGPLGEPITWMAKAAIGVGVLYGIQTGATLLMKKAGVAFPGALAGALCLAAALLAIGKQPAQPLLQYYESYLSWAPSVLPLLYVPILVTMPTLLRGTDLRALIGFSLAGAATSLMFAAAVASALIPQSRLATVAAAAAVNTPLLSAPSGTTPAPGGVSQPPPPGSSNDALLLSVTALAAMLSLTLTKIDPVGLGNQMTVPVGITWTLLGWLAGRALRIKPMVLGAAAAKLGVFWHGKLLGRSYLTSMEAYFGQGTGAGEMFVSLLGIPLTGLGFVIYKNRRHINLPAVVGTAVASLAFTVAVTLGVARLTQMSDVWTRAFLTRSITAGVALDVGQIIAASPECAAIAALLQAAIVVKLGGPMLRLLGTANSAVTGIAAGCTAGGIGVAAVAKDDLVALANGILAYTVMHMLCTLATCTPAVGHALQAVVRCASM